MGWECDGECNNCLFDGLVYTIFQVWFLPADFKQRFDASSVPRSLIAIKSIPGKAHDATGFGDIAEFGGKVEQSGLVFDDVLIKTFHGKTPWASGPVEGLLALPSKRSSPLFTRDHCQVRSKLLQVISTNGLSIFHAANVYKKIEGIGLTVDSKLSAILREGSLKFHSFHLLRQIFDVSEYYKEATDCDIDQFASMSCVMVADSSKLIAISDTWVRRKLWLISQSQILEKVPVADIKTVAAEFHIELNTEIDDGAEKLVIPEEKKQLKTILRFLDEDYYKSPLLANYYLANSKRPI